MQELKKSLRVIRRNIYELSGNPKYSKPSAYNLDDKLAKYLNFKGGFFIEAGANDGYTQSNTYYLEKILGWKGLLVEATPELYQKCKRERKQAYTYNCALVSQDYQDSSIEIKFANLMSTVKGARKNADEEVKHIAKGLKVQDIASSYTVKVPARTLDSILQDIPQPLKIDFFSLDVEGYELEVLKGFDLAKYKPTYILVEADFFEEVDSWLNGMYELVEKMSHHDYLYRLKKAPELEAGEMPAI